MGNYAVLDEGRFGIGEQDGVKCPKCGGDMEKGRRLWSYGGVTFAKKDDFWGDKIVPFY